MRRAQPNQLGRPMLKALPPFCGCTAVSSSVKRGSDDYKTIIKYFIEANLPIDPDVALDIAEAGDLELLALLDSVGAPLFELTPAWAAEGGHIHVLNWLKEKARWSSF